MRNITRDRQTDDLRQAQVLGVRCQVLGVRCQVLALSLGSSVSGSARIFESRSWNKSHENYWGFQCGNTFQGCCHPEQSEGSAFVRRQETADSSRQNRALGMTILFMRDAPSPLGASLWMRSSIERARPQMRTRYLIAKLTPDT